MLAMTCLAITTNNSSREEAEDKMQPSLDLVLSRITLGLKTMLMLELLDRLHVSNKDNRNVVGEISSRLIRDLVYMLLG